MSDNEKKTSDKFANFLSKASDVGKKAAVGIQKGAHVVSEQTKKTIHEQKMKKYNPLFMEKYQDEHYDIPNIIQIVDDADYKNIDVCEGAIGLTRRINETEVLFLYDTAVEKIDVEFIPNADVGQIYYKDRFNHKRFIQVDDIFERTVREKVAELEKIACSLGAKSCLIQIEQAEIESNSKTVNFEVADSNNKSVQYQSRGMHNDKQNEVMVDQGRSYERARSISGENRTYFSCNDVPTRPELKWFAKEDAISGLVDIRCNGNNAIRSKLLVFKGSSATTMSKKNAYTIDCLMNNSVSLKTTKISQSKGVKRVYSMAEKAHIESNSKFIFDIEF